MNTNTMNNNIIQRAVINVHTTPSTIVSGVQSLPDAFGAVSLQKLTLENPDPDPNLIPPYNFKLFDNPNLTFATLNIVIADTPMINQDQLKLK